MKKYITSALIIMGFALAAFVAPDVQIKISEKSAAACGDPDCGGD